MREYGVEVVQAYMSHIQTTAEMSVRQLMKQVTSFCLFSKLIFRVLEFLELLLALLFIFYAYF